MQENSEEQTISRLFELENSDQAERRAELTGERFLSLINDPNDGRGYVLRHGTDETEGAEIPPDTEFWEYPNAEAAAQAFEQLLAEARQAGELVEEDSTEDMGDSETSGAEVRDRYADADGDLLIEDDEPEESET
ncbi:MAG TPA: hypothetical protein VJT78_04525 [Candidatus Dormibacteraeota bacterium]|nr:hypothetical protein [Candidatus Dormibacteraeota bacterium]